jgi:hypothetical protein
MYDDSNFIKGLYQVEAMQAVNGHETARPDRYVYVRYMYMYMPTYYSMWLPDGGYAMYCTAHVGGKAGEEMVRRRLPAVQQGEMKQRY